MASFLTYFPYFCVLGRILAIIFWEKMLTNTFKINLPLNRKIFSYLIDIELTIRPILTLTRPLRKKLRMRWFFDVFKVKESSFFKSDLTDPPQIFDAHLLENTNLSLSSFHFSVSFYIKIMFWFRWFYSLFERMRSKRKTMFIHTIHNFLSN